MIAPPAAIEPPSTQLDALKQETLVTPFIDAGRVACVHEEPPFVVTSMIGIEEVLVPIA
jgi:hypothetical protein